MSNSTPRALAAVLEIMYCCATFEGGQLGVSVKISLTKQQWTRYLKKHIGIALGIFATFQTWANLWRSCHLLCVALKDIHRMDRRISEIPQTEGGVAWRCHHETLRGMCTTMRELLVVPYNHTPEHVMKIRLFISTYTWNDVLMFFSLFPKQKGVTIILNFNPVSAVKVWECIWRQKPHYLFHIQ